MSRPDLLRNRIGDGYVVLVEIIHPVLGDPIRIVTDNADINALGKTWLKGRLNLRLPSEVEGARTAQIIVQNVDRRIGEGARQMITPATVYFKIVRVEDPDTIEVDYPPMFISGATGDAATVTGDLTSILNGSNPARNARATKDTAPAAYR